MCRTDVKEEIGWNGQEERAVEPEERDDEDGTDSTAVREEDGGTRAHIYTYAAPTAACGLPRLFVPGRLPLILQTANNTPRARRFVRGTRTAPSIDLDALTAGQRLVIETFAAPKNGDRLAGHLSDSNCLASADLSSPVFTSTLLGECATSRRAALGSKGAFFSNK